MARRFRGNRHPIYLDDRSLPHLTLDRDTPTPLCLDFDQTAPGRPISTYRSIGPRPEKLEGERRYALQLGVHYTVGDASLYPTELFAQLESMVDAAYLHPKHPLQTVLRDFLEARCALVGQESLEETLHRLQRDWALSLSHATFLLDHMLWHQMIDCDLSRPIHRSLPPVPGGRALKTALRNAFAGGEQ